MKKSELNQKILNYRYKVELASASTSDADALECIELFPYWEINKSVIVGERLQYNGELYKCLQAHTTQADWTPDVTPALWKKVSIDNFPPYEQPQGSADAYMKDDGVTFESKQYICLIDYTVHSPAEYPLAWEEQPNSEEIIEEE